MYLTYKPRAMPIGDAILRELRALMRDEGWMAGYREWQRLRNGEPEPARETGGMEVGTHGVR